MTNQPIGSVPISRAEYDRLWREKVEEARERFAPNPLGSLELQWVGDQLTQYQIEERASIQPALTPEEWKEFKRSGGLRITWYPAGGRLPQLGINAAELMAISNASLPDGDPRKITRADVRLLEAYSGCIPDRIFDLIAKLAALLPPE